MNNNLRKNTLLPIYYSFIQNAKTAEVSPGTIKSMLPVYILLKNNKENLTESETKKILSAWKYWLYRANHQNETQTEVSAPAITPGTPTGFVPSHTEPTVVDIDMATPRIGRQLYPYLIVAAGSYLLYLIVQKNI